MTVAIIRLCLRKILSRSDVLEIIDYLNGSIHAPWSPKSITQGHFDDWKEFNHVKFCHTRRNVNVVTHLFASFWQNRKSYTLLGFNFNLSLSLDTGPI